MTAPQRMSAVVMSAFGGPDVLEPVELPMPAPGPGEALVRVRAVAVARTRDLATRAGHPPFGPGVRPPHVLGGAHVGEVVAYHSPCGMAPAPETRVAVAGSVRCGTCRMCRNGLDASCSRFQMLGIHCAGSYAEFVAVPGENLHPLPDVVDDAAAAVLAANGPIAWAQLEAALVRPGTTVVVTGATGALGTMLASLAATRGASVLATSRRPDALVGLDAVALGANDQDLAAAVLDRTGGMGAQAVIDNVGAPPQARRLLEALAPHGRYVLSGSRVREPLAFDPVRLYLGGNAIVGVRTASHAQTRAFWVAVRDGMAPHLPETDAFPLERAAEAHAAMETGVARHVVLRVASA